MPDLAPQLKHSDCLPSENARHNYLFIRFDRYRGVEDVLRGMVKLNDSFTVRNGSGDNKPIIQTENTRLIFSISGIDEIKRLAPFIRLIHASNYQTIVINNLSQINFYEELYNTFPEIKHLCTVVQVTELNDFKLN